MLKIAGALLCATSVCMLATTSIAQETKHLPPVTADLLTNPPNDDWLMFRRTYDGHGFSPLDQITKSNVSDLQLAWSRGIQLGNQEITPLVHDGVMYLGQAPDVIQAMDATNGDLIWEYKRELASPCVVFSAGCSSDGENVPITAIRNIAIAGDRLIHLTQDNAIIALEARTGKLIWETQIRTSENWGWQTSGAIIVGNLAISGRACGQVNVQGDASGCFITAHDVATGSEVWRFHTVPQPGEAGYETWANLPYEARRHVGTWMPPTYDPELNRVYFGTSVTSPWAKYSVVEKVDMDEEFLYQTSTLAIDATSGKLDWYQQHIRDHWDLDHPFTRVLVETEVSPSASEVRWINPNVTAGDKRSVATGIFGKTGILYSLDRETGEFLWARETVEQNVVSDIDTSNGRAVMNFDVVPQSKTDRPIVCPGPYGGLDWAVGSYSPIKNVLYYPLANLCTNGPLDGKAVGTVQAFSAETGSRLWTYDNEAYTTSLLATAGELIFSTDLNRRFRAHDEDTGKVLWETVLPTAIGGTPISYAVDGRQYVAVVAAPPFTLKYLGGNARAEYPDAGGNSVMVFALPEN